MIVGNQGKASHISGRKLRTKWNGIGIGCMVSFIMRINFIQYVFWNQRRPCGCDERSVVPAAFQVNVPSLN